MKRSLVLLIAVMLGITSFSQSVTIHFKDGGTEKHKMGLIESIEFTDDDELETSASIYLERAGMLSSKISKSHASELLKLKISGHMDARDFDFIKWDCMKVEEVDLSDVVIDGYSGVEGTEEGNNKTYQANEIPSGAFFYWKDVHKYYYDGMPIDEGMPSLKKIVLPNGIKAIRRNAFARAYNLININIPEGVETIDFVSFAICTSLEHITLPSTLKTVGELAFADMSSLRKVYISATTPPSASSNAFQGLSKEAILYVPKGTENLYRNSVGWKTFSQILSLDDDNDDNKNYSDIGIVGVWKVVDYTSSAMVSILSDLTLYADGTFKTQTSRGTWKLNGNELTLNDNNNEVIFTIENFTGNEITLRATIKGSTLVLYLKRVGDADVEQGNDDSEASPSSFLVGTWQTISVEGWGMEVKVDEIDYLQIKSDGNYIHVEWENNAPYVSKGKWTLANNKFTIKESEGDNVGAAYVYDLAIINSDKITMTMWDAKATLIRVSDSVMDKYINK